MDEGPRGHAFGPGEATVQPGGSTLPLSAVRAAEVAAETAPRRTLTAEWALWGKDVHRTELHVLRCSKGRLTSDDFQEIFTRYATGVKEHLPQYTVCWIPADGSRPPYLAVAIHELADDPASAAGRSQAVAGRVVEYVRLFAFAYDEAARLQAGYASLVDAVQGELLAAGSSEPIRVRLAPSAGQPDSVSPRADLAQAVAARLLARNPVCVLDAEGVSARDRLLFIDEVMSLLPFGLRATLSASTWASPTARDLKLRLFFSSARRDSGTRTGYESWVRADQRPRPAGDDAAQLYLEWLRQAGPGATSKLAGMKDPVRFSEPEIRDAIRHLPEDRTPEECAKDLSDALRANDPTEVLAALAPLRLYLRKRPKSVDSRELAVYRELAKKYWFFRNYPALDYQVRSDVYSTLLELGFTAPLTYAGYCDIRLSARDYRLAWPLRLLLLGAAPPPDKLVYILAAKAGPHFSDAELMDDLSRQGLRPPDLLRYLERRIDSVTEQRDRVTLIDFAVDYLTRDRDHQAELIQQGYLSEFLARAYPDDAAGLQAEKLNYTVRLAHGIVDGSAGLNVKQIREIFANPRVNQAGPIKQVVKGLAMSQSWSAFEQGEKKPKNAREGGPQHKTGRTPPFLRPQPRRPDRDRLSPTRAPQPERTRVLDPQELGAEDYYAPVTFRAFREYALIGGLILLGGLLVWVFIELLLIG
jgi:hypothetical protein